MIRRQAGFTLIELMVGMALMILIMGGIAGLLTSFIKHGTQGIELTDRRQEARWAVDMIAQDLRYAKKINTPVGDSSSLDLIKLDSNGRDVRVRYDAIDSGNGNYILQRKVFIPADSAIAAATSPIGNTKRGYVKSGDFAVTVTVGLVHIVYNVRRDAADSRGAMAQATIYPLKNLIAVP